MPKTFLCPITSFNAPKGSEASKGHSKSRHSKHLHFLRGTPVSSSSLQGLPVRVDVRNGQTYNAVLHAASHSGTDRGICLVEAVCQSTGERTPKLIIMAKDICTVSCLGMQTDAQIAGTTKQRHKEMQPWVDDGLVTTPLDSKTNEKYDQFEVMEKKFGVVSDFNSDDYTTIIDKSGPDYKQRERHADKIAKEIMQVRMIMSIDSKNVSSNAHVAEERNQVNPQNEHLDEEDK